MRRELRVVDTEKALGSVVYENGTLTWDGPGEFPMPGLRHRLGDQALGDQLMRDGWSNGYLYLAAPQ